MLQSECESLFSSSLWVCWTDIASPSLIVTYNQYLVFGCRVKSSVVVNVISLYWGCYF